MPILSPTEIYGRVEALLVNPDREAGLESARRDQVAVSYAGFEGEAHGGLTRPSCTRVRAQYPTRGTKIRNSRQITILSAEELAEVAEKMDLSEILPEWVGANLVLSGIPDLTLLPPASRLIFENGAALVVDMENGPCRFPGEVIERHHPGKGAAFPQAALGKRGVTGWVEREGAITVGESCRLHIPPQRIYHHAAAIKAGKITVPPAAAAE